MGHDAALGALLGAAVGDAVGAFLEFDEVTPRAVERALTLPGGGCWNVGPGQFTDDTELALCQAHGLVGHAPSGGLPANAVAREYAWWCNKSEPFDIGFTTRQAFRLNFARTTDFAAVVQANVRNDASLASKANGATMRATPLAIWAHRLSAAAAADAAMQDAALSHPNQACQHANAAYVLAVAALVRRPGDAEGALAAAESWAAVHARGEVRGWLAEARDDGAMAGYQATEQIGFVAHALRLAFYHLRRRSTFLEALRHTLAAGGDTDTNACIVCGVVGALHGAAAIPAHLRSKVEGYRPLPPGQGEQAGRAAPGVGCERPERLWGAHLAPLARRLYEEAAADAGVAGQAASAEMAAA